MSVPDIVSNVSTVVADAGGELFTAMANAARLAEQAAEQAAHVDEMKDKWFIYDGTRLGLEPRTSMIPHVKVVAQNLFGEAHRCVEQAEELELSLARSGNASVDAIAD